jgi:uncharacterized membrane protein YcaP (DUF421 family)
MRWHLSANWSTVFIPSVPLLETVLRGTIIYLALFFLMRFAFRRQAGTVSLTDLLMILLISEASQNAMSSEHRSVTDGLALVLTIAFWDYALDWLSFRFPRLRSVLRPPPLPLVRDGRILRRNMQKEMVTREELMSQLREQGVEDVSEVRLASLEGDGRISIIKRKPDDDPCPRAHPIAT